VSASKIDAARKYIREQEKHHQKRSFQDELRAFLAAANVSFDEKYLWACRFWTDLPIHGPFESCYCS